MRLGYFSTLVRLIQKFEEISVAQLLDLVKKELHASGSSKSVSKFIFIYFFECKSTS